MSRGGGNYLRRASRAVDRVVEVFSPERAVRRARFRLAYDALDGSRLRKKRTVTGGTADSHLDSRNLNSLREIQRDLMRNSNQKTIKSTGRMGCQSYEP